MSGVEVQPVEDVRFVVCRRDIHVSRNDRKSTIRAGSLVRVDTEIVKTSPGEFYEPHTYRFNFDISVFGRDDGQFLQKITNTMAEDGLPAPGPNALDHWRRFWESKLRKQGLDPWDVEVENLEGTTYVVRASISRAVPPAPQIIVNVPQSPPPSVSVYIDSEPLTAVVEFERDPDGQITAATIQDTAEPEETDGQLPD